MSDIVEIREDDYEQLLKESEELYGLKNNKLKWKKFEEEKPEAYKTLLLKRMYNNGSVIGLGYLNESELLDRSGACSYDPDNVRYVVLKDLLEMIDD